MTDIAFCIFGQLRDDDHVLPLTAKLALELGATVFVSTWRRRGAKVGGIIQMPQAAHLFGYEPSRLLPGALCAGPNFFRALPGFDMALMGRQPDVEAAQLMSHFPEAVIDIEGDELCLDFREPAVADTNSLRMLYKAWRCNELKRSAEKRRERPFDVVVRFRADLVPSIENLEHLIATLRDNEVCIPGAGLDYVNDTLAMSSSGAADSLAAAFGTALLSPGRPWEMIHHALARHIRETGLVARNISFLPILTTPERQMQNLRLLLEAIRTGAIDPDFFPNPATWPSTASLLEAQVRLDEAGAEGALGIVNTLDLPALDLDQLRCVGNLLESCFRANGAAGSLCTARLLGVVIAVLLDPAGQDDYLRNRMPVDQVADALIDISDKRPLDALLHERVLEPGELDPALSPLHAEVLGRAGSEQVRAILDGIGVVLAQSFQVQSVRFNKALHQRGDFPAAIAIAEGMTERFPDDSQGHDLLGHARERNGDHRGAYIAAQSALCLDPQNPGLMTRLGMLSLGVDRLDEAHDLFDAARSVWVDDRPWAGLVTTAIARGRSGEAAALVKEGLARFPNSTWLGDLSQRVQALA